MIKKLLCNQSETLRYFPYDPNIIVFIAPVVRLLRCARRRDN